MPISPLSYAVWVTGTALELLCCYLLLRRNLVKRLPLLVAYVALVTVNDLGSWVFLHSRLASREAVYYAYWGSEAVLVTARGLAIMDLCRQILRPYRGVWALSRLIFASLATVLAVAAFVQAWGARAWMRALVMSADRIHELMAAALIVTLLAVCRYYGVPIPKLFLFLLVGFGGYSAVQVANNSFYHQFRERYNEVWRVVDPATYVTCILVWCWALWKRLPAEQPQPALLEAGTYGVLAPQMNQRLRELNHRLEEMFRG